VRGFPAALTSFIGRDAAVHEVSAPPGRARPKTVARR